MAYKSSAGYVNAITQTNDSGYALLIALDLPGPHKFLLMKTDSAVNGVQSRNFEDLYAGPHYAGDSIIQTCDSGYVFIESKPNDPTGIWLIKTCADGSSDWEQ